MQPHTMLEPPLCLIVGWTICLDSSFWGFFQQYCCPSDPIRLIFVSSEKIMCAQSSSVLWWYVRVKWRWRRQWLWVRSGFLALTQPYKFVAQKIFLTHWLLTESPDRNFACGVVSTHLKRMEWTRQQAWLVLIKHGWPPLLWGVEILNGFL